MMCVDSHKHGRTFSVSLQLWYDPQTKPADPSGDRMVWHKEDQAMQHCLLFSTYNILHSVTHVIITLNGKFNNGWRWGRGEVWVGVEQGTENDRGQSYKQYSSLHS